jgi:hypothetical protein
MDFNQYWARQCRWFDAQQAEYRAMEQDPSDYGIDWREIPIFIINRNRLDCGFRPLVNWLLYEGSKEYPSAASLSKRAINSNITVIDNGSTYPPLLDYYRTSGLNVRYMDRNGGPWIFWEDGMYKDIHTPYIVTDADVAPDKECPNDLIEKLLFTLRSHMKHVIKVGPSLRIDNLPDHYAKKANMLQSEHDFWLEGHRATKKNSPWLHPDTPGMFRAGIDTTFAMYRPRAPFVNGPMNYRLDKPYVFEHHPWYVDSSNLPEEEAYYYAHRENGWSGC